MQGSGIGTMNIYHNSPKTKPIWSKTGDQGDMWRHGRVTIGKNMRTNYRVSFNIKF